MEETTWTKTAGIDKEQKLEVKLSRTDNGEWSIIKFSETEGEFIVVKTFYEAIYRMNEALVKLGHEPELK